MRFAARFLLVFALLSGPFGAAFAQDRTQAFLLHASATNRFQINAAQLALKKTQSGVVHGFASQMSLDYTAANMKLRYIANDAKLKMPHEAYDPPHKALMDGLTKTAPGKTLSKAYFEVQDKALRADLAIFEAYGKSGDNDRLVDYAQGMVPILRGQIDQLDKVKRDVK